ncbi:MAG: hypothetical protein K0R82_2476, partial [Flavipsychrobacter sp.]|nr:hypothetical protein [Flavipsychrobacter sp.]
MREINVYSDRLAGIEKEQEQKDFFIQADPAQFDPYEIRSWSSKEVTNKVEEE